MAGERQLVAVLDVETEDGQLTGCRDLAVELAQRTGCRVARIGKQRLFVELALGIERIENRALHIDFTAHDQAMGCVLEGLGNVFDGAQVFGNVLTHLAIAAGRAAHKYAVDILERNRKAVDLILHDVRRLLSGTGNPVVKLGKLVERKHILQALKRIGVRDLGKLLVGLTAYAVGRRIRIVKLGIFGLERAQFALHHIIIVVRNLGRVLVVVFLIVIPELLAQ